FCSRMISIAVALSVLIGVRQQRQEARTLHGHCELPLIERLRARDAARNDLARLGDVALQRGQILVVDVLHAFGGEAAELLPTGEAAVGALSVHGHGLALSGRCVVIIGRFFARRAIATALAAAFIVLGL